MAEEPTAPIGTLPTPYAGWMNYTPATHPAALPLRRREALAHLAELRYDAERVQDYRRAAALASKIVTVKQVDDASFDRWFAAEQGGDLKGIV